MPAKPKSSTSQTSPQPTPTKGRHKKIIIMTLLCILAIATAFILVQRNQEQKRQEAAYQADKATFATVEAEMAKTPALIRSRIGETDKVESTKSCSRIAHKYDKGQLYCGLSFRFEYPLSSVQEAVSKTQIIESIFSSEGWLSAETSGSLSDDIDPSKVEQSGSKQYTAQSGVDCDLSFRMKNGSSDAAIPGSRLATAYTFKCNKDMNRPIYPLAE